MEKEEDMKTQNGGIVNYFQGATINNLVINGNMTKSGTENFYTAQSDSKMEDPEREVNINTVAQALDKCKSYLWGQAALATVFCVCRDVYHLGDNASWFERKMEQMEINCPPGTIANAMAERLGIHDKWKVFETLWNRKNMYRDYYKALNLLQSLDFQDEIKRTLR